MWAYRGIFPILIALAVALVPVTARGSNGHFAQAESCYPYGGFTYCVSIQYEIDCAGWNRTWFGFGSPDGGPIIGGGPLAPVPDASGSWILPGVYESFEHDFTLRLWISYTEFIDLRIITLFREPTACDFIPEPTCPVDNQYYMYTFRDDNQPASWQDYCYIISSNGYPSVEAQAYFCSVPGFDHVYIASRLLYSGWVQQDCNQHIHYGWSPWDPSWYIPDYAK